MMVNILVSALTNELAPRYKTAINKSKRSGNNIFRQNTSVGNKHIRINVTIMPFIGKTNKVLGL